MHTGIISFADRIVHNIKTNEMKDFILDQLYSLYNIKIIQKQYHKLDKNNIKYVINNPHLCNLRSNGNPYLMFFTLYNDIPIIYFVDKKIHPGYQKPRILLVRGLFSESLFKNTLIDGEMVKCTDGNWVFLFNDIIAYEGCHLIHSVLPDRLKILYKLLDTQHTKDDTIDVCRYQIKRYHYIHKDSISELIEWSKMLNYTCRGIYMWSYSLKYKSKLYNFNEENIVNVVRKVKDETEFQMISETSEIIESKTQNYNELKDTNVTKTRNEYKKIIGNENIDSVKQNMWVAQSDYPDVYYIYETENVITSKRMGTILIPDLNTSKIMRNLFKNKNVGSVLSIMCCYNEKFKKWYPIEVIDNK
jgi:hypothetical protein